MVINRKLVREEREISFVGSFSALLLEREDRQRG